MRILYAYIAICAILSGLAVWVTYSLISPSELAMQRTIGSESADKPFKGARRICAPGAICPWVLLPNYRGDTAIGQCSLSDPYRPITVCGWTLCQARYVFL